jgi:hypothetical protein
MDKGIPPRMNAESQGKGNYQKKLGLCQGYHKEVY